MIKKSKQEEHDRDEWNRIIASAKAKGKIIVDDAEPGSDFASMIVSNVLSYKNTKTDYGHAPRFYSFRRAIFFKYIPAAAASVVLALFIIDAASTSRSSDSYLSKTSNDNAQITLYQADRLTEIIAGTQQSDGSWTPGSHYDSLAYRPALTALSILALERHARDKHTAEIEKARDALAAMQNPNGTFGSSADNLYTHALATYALLKTSDSTEGITPSLQNAIDHILTEQNCFGAWDYEKNGEGNAALTMWQAGILTEAVKHGWTDSEGKMRRALAWLNRESQKGLFDYRATRDREKNPSSGSIVLTQLASDSVTEFLHAYESSAPLVYNIKTSLDTACGRYAVQNIDSQSAFDRLALRSYKEGDSVYPVIIALLGIKQ